METDHRNELNQPVFFIIGLPRSGTTLLEQMLDAHSKLAVCPEMASGYTLWRLNASKEIRDSWKHLLIINNFYTRTNIFKDLINMHLAIQAIRSFKFPVSTSAWFAPLISDYLTEKKGILFGEKTPENTFFIPALYKTFPEGRFIMILRNPFDIITSLAEAVLNSENAPIPDRWIYHFAWIVKRGMLNMQLERLPNTIDLIYVTYEDLTTNPHLVLKKICTFLNIDFEESMLTFQHRKKYARNNEVMQRILGRLDEPLTNQRVNRSYSILSPLQYAYLHAFWANALKKLPYTFPPASTTLPWSMKMRLHLALLAFNFKAYLLIDYKNKFRIQCQYFALRYLRNTIVKSRLLKHLITEEKDWQKIIEQYNT